MKYKVKTPFSVDTNPVTVQIVDGDYVREIKQRTFKAGATITAAKMKGIDVQPLLEKGVIVALEEVDDAR